MIAFVHTVVLLAGLQAIAPQAPSQPVGMVAHVPRWSVYELALNASDKDSDPYVEVDLIGVFSGPDGESIVVGGFWDGGHTFRVRFTPPVEGTWTYSTVSSDPGLDGQMGSFICTAPGAGEHGFVRGGPAAQTAWTFDDGAPAWSALQVIHVRVPVTPNETAETNGAVGPNDGGGAPIRVVETSASANANANASANVSAGASAGVGPRASVGAGAGTIAGAQRAALAANDDEPASMTRDRLDLSMLKDADRAVETAKKSGAIAEVELFDPAESLAVDEAEAHRLLDYLIARYGAYPNVVWCLHDAGPAPDRDTRAMWKDIVAAVHMQDPYFAEGPNVRVLQMECSAPAAPATATPTSSSF
jgi:hypothetical protein